MWISHGAGSKIVDADGIEYVDLHGGYGVGAVGHAHPAIVEAVSRRVREGTHFAQPTEDALIVSEELARRWGLPLWRFANSGTEATMDAVHLMRAITGRSLIVKIEGCYHGHHDSVQVSVYPAEDEIGPASRPNSVPSSSGVPSEITDLTLHRARTTTSTALERVFAEHPRRDRRHDPRAGDDERGHRHAGRRLPRGADRHRARATAALVAFDEVKTGFTVAAGGATEFYGVRPDIVCLAKALGGGLPVAAIGGTAEVMERIVDGTYEQVGTFNGNPLGMAAARAALTEVLTAEAYRRFDTLRELIVEGCETAISDAGLPAHVVAIGAKGCVTFTAEPVRNFRDFLELDDRYSHCHWLFQHNGGVFLPPWGKAEQWLLSAQHSEADAAALRRQFRAIRRGAHGLTVAKGAIELVALRKEFGECRRGRRHRPRRSPAASSSPCSGRPAAARRPRCA